jgi:predicted RNA-binding protein YlqC (UPF0109 family)
LSKQKRATSAATEPFTPLTKGTTAVESTAATLLSVVRRLVSIPDLATVQCLSTNGTTTILLTVAAIDFIRVTGEDGRTARSLRTVVSAIASTSNEHVQLAIEAIDGKHIEAAP